MKMATDQIIWNTVFGILFLAVVLLSARYVSHLPTSTQLQHFSVFDLLVVSLAAFRLTRLFTFDKITAFIREWFLDSGENGTLQKPPHGVRRTMAELLECLWCTGLWAALIAYVLYASNLFLLGVFLVQLLAIAALASILQLLSKKIGAHT